MRRSLPTVLVVAGYTIATAVMTWPYVNWAALGSAIYPGDARLIAWTLAWNNHALLSGESIFNANIFYPAPGALAYNDANIGISLFTLPIYAATGNAILAYNVVHVSTFLLNGLAMHLLAFRLTRSHPAAFVGGLIYAFSFYMMLHGHGHLTLIWAWLLPLSLVLIDRWIDRPTLPRALMWGLAVLLQVLSAWYLGVITIVSNAIVIVWRHATDVHGQWRTRAWHVAIVVAGCAAVIWPVAMPYRRSIGVPSLAEVRSFSADWASYFVPPLNTIVGQWWAAHINADPRWIWGELTVFLGWIAVALAAAGIIAGVVTRQWRTAGVYVVIILTGGALSFGPSGPGDDWPRLFDAMRLLPGVSGLRAPARFSVMVLLGVAMLASYAIAHAHRRFGRRAYVLVGVLVPLMLAEWFVVDFPGGRPQPADSPAIYRHPAVLAARAIVSLPDYSGTDRWFQGADYLLYSTGHWRPIVNGFGRTEPKDHASVISHMRAFPGPNNARTMRRLGIELVVLHAAEYGAAAADMVSTALDTGEYDLVAQEGTIHLFRVRPEAARDAAPPDARAVRQPALR